MLPRKKRNMDGRNNRDFTYSKSVLLRTSAPATLKCRPSERIRRGHLHARDIIEVTVDGSMVSRLFLPSTAAGVALKAR